MFFRRKTKENHTKSVQNIRELLFSLGKTKEKPKKKDTPKKTPQNRPSVQFYKMLQYTIICYDVH